MMTHMTNGGRKVNRPQRSFRCIDTTPGTNVATRIIVGVCGLIALIALSAVAAAAPMFNGPAPDVYSVSPSHAYNSQPSEVTITGLDFTATPTVTLGIMPLPDVTFVSTTTLTATVPADLPAGAYELTVTNPDGQSANLGGAFTVMSSGDGSLGRWQATTSMAAPRGMHAVALSGDYVYALGGYGGSGYLNSVEWAAINSDGTLGPWQFTTSMTTPRSEFAAVASGDYVYALGGHDRVADVALNTVERAAINPDGTLGPWQTTSPMTTPRISFAAVTSNGYVYALGGYDGIAEVELNTVERTEIKPDGTLGPWTMATPLPTTERGHAAVVSGGYLYVVGGQNLPDISAERAAINPDGTLSPWQSVSPMTSHRTQFAAVVSRGYLYALAGDGIPQGEKKNTVERAAISPDGSLAAWQETNSIPARRWGSPGVASRGYLYVVGGGDPPGSVLWAMVNPPAPPLLYYSVSINDGALFTNQVTVTLTVGAPAEILQMQVSNDGGFAGAAWESYAQEKRWQITRYGNYVIPRVVYVRYKDCEGDVSSTYQDDIILDVTAPSGSVESTAGAAGTGLGEQNVGSDPTTHGDVGANAVYPYSLYLPQAVKCYPPLPTGAANVTLHLSATDDVSGVGSMMISNRADFYCESWETCATSKGWYVPSGTTTVYVKFRDNAGNVSDVATHTITR